MICQLFVDIVKFAGNTILSSTNSTIVYYNLFTISSIITPEKLRE